LGWALGGAAAVLVISSVTWGLREGTIAARVTGAIDARRLQLYLELIGT
jgi:hypothetical protein